MSQEKYDAYRAKLAETPPPDWDKPNHEREPLDDAAHKIDELRSSLLFDNAVTDGLDGLAEQHFLLAMSALEQAWRQMQIAHIHQTRALARNR